MPEGHVLHRLARTLEDDFGSKRVAVTSPQGRFAESAALLDGCVLSGAEACGKHLFIAFDAPVAEPIVHVHLGLIGKLQFTPLTEPVGQVRLRITDGITAADLRGPQTCRTLSPSQMVAEIAKLGPDPIRVDADPEVAWRRIHASGRSIASLLMDQRVTAGVGNIYRAEVLFRHHVAPSCPGNKLKRATWDAIWTDLVVLMRDGVAVGRIDTVLPDHSPEVQGRAPRVDRHGGEVYVYRRAGDPCLVCGHPVKVADLEGRNLYWCSTCQRRH